MSPIKFTDEQFKELYSQGLNDAQIAKQLGVVSQTVAYWRRKFDLPRNKHPKMNLKELK